MNYEAGSWKNSSATKSNLPKWLAQKGSKQKTNGQSGLFDRYIYVLSLYQVLKITVNFFACCTNWCFLVGFRRTFASQNFWRPRQLFYLNSPCWHIAISVSESKSQSQKGRNFFRIWKEDHNLERLQEQNGAAYWSVRNLVQSIRSETMFAVKDVEYKMFYTRRYIQ